MAAAQATIGTQERRNRGAGVSPLASLVCGVLLMLGGAFLHWMEPGPAAKATVADEAATRSAASARALQKTREREALARLEQERVEAEEAAERTRRATMMADAASEAQARKEREEFAQRQAAATAAERASAESEDAWKRFYRPSEACRDPGRATSVECVNEYVKAKREFHGRAAARTI